MKLKSVFATTGVVLLLGFAGASFFRFENGPEESPYLMMPISRGEIAQVVSATGTLQAVTTVQVGSQISGTIAKLHADFNSRVHKDEPIAELDQSKFMARVDEQKAALLQTEADIARVKVALEEAQRILTRATELKKRDLISQSEVDAAQTAADAALAQLEVAKARVQQARAALNQALVDLNHTVIRSPVEGVVISRNVDVGQTVAASFQAPTLFTIANDLSKMEVHTNVDEADVGNVWVGQGVTFTVDAYPARRFRGRVGQVRHVPNVVQNVVTYDAVAEIRNSELLLKPGMTANVEFLVNHKEDVLRVPNPALRFRPASEKQNPRELRGLQSHQGGGRRVAEGRGRRSARSGEREPRTGRVYLLKNGVPTPLQLRLGVTDSLHTEVQSGDLAGVQEVVVGVADTAKKSEQSAISKLFTVRRRGGFR